MLGREPNRKETMLFNELNHAHISTNVKQIGIVQRKIQVHIAECIQYRSVLSSTSFLATFLYMNMFGYLIYFVLMFVVLVLPFQSLFWITVTNPKYLIYWLPIVVLIIIKSLTQFCLLRRLEMNVGQYRGIPHPRLTTWFDMLQMFLSAIVGWAPAIVRIVASFVATLIMLPRLDLKLPGSTIDTSFLKFNGVMEGWRIQTEYRIVAEHFKRNRPLDIEEEVDAVEEAAAAQRRVSSLNPAFDVVDVDDKIK